MWCKSLDIMFAKAHFIEDSHAMRSLDSRLGTAFNFVLLLVVVGLFSYVFTAPNTLRTNTLVPTSTMGTNTTYGYLNVTIEAFAPRAEGDGFTSCDDGAVKYTSSSGFTCVASPAPSTAEVVGAAETETTMLTTLTEALTICRLELNCATKSSESFRGTQDVMFELSDEFQTISWTVTNSKWGPEELPLSTHHVLGPTPGSGVLVGTKQDPTTLNFGASKSVRRDTRPEVLVEEGGLELTWRATRAVEKKTEGTVSGTHFVAVMFDVQETTYVKVLSTEMSLFSQIGAVATYVLSVIGVMNMAKIFTQLAIDKYYMMTREEADVPEDVRIRNGILTEMAATMDEGDGEGLADCQTAAPCAKAKVETWSPGNARAHNVSCLLEDQEEGDSKKKWRIRWSFNWINNEPESRTSLEGRATSN
jgi:hypothetical protein